MTNAQLIEIAKTRFAKDGILSYTGRVVSCINPASGESVQIPEIEPIHTFLGWRERADIKLKRERYHTLNFLYGILVKRKIVNLIATYRNMEIAI